MFPLIIASLLRLRKETLPRRGAEGLAGCHSRLNGSTIGVKVVEGIVDYGVLINTGIHEPLGRVDLAGQDESEENHGGANVKARIETSRSDVVVLAPPALEPALDEAVEEHSNYAP